MEMEVLIDDGKIEGCVFGGLESAYDVKAGYDNIF